MTRKSKVNQLLRMTLWSLWGSKCDREVALLLHVTVVLEQKLAI